eukprot:4779802-Ditylum_brightwellii.AAC.1
MSLTYLADVENYLAIEEGKETSLKESQPIDVGYTGGSTHIAGKRVCCNEFIHPHYQVGKEHRKTYIKSLTKFLSTEDASEIIIYKKDQDHITNNFLTVINNPLIIGGMSNLV